MVFNWYNVARLGLVIGIMTALATGCSSRSFPLLYRQPVIQGNRVTVERFEQVRLGMTREQVQYILGSPSYIDPFHPDRWNYYFSQGSGNKTIQQHTMVFFFTDNALIRIDGQPAEGERISDFLGPSS